MNMNDRLPIDHPHERAAYMLGWFYGACYGACIGLLMGVVLGWCIKSVN